MVVIVLIIEFAPAGELPNDGFDNVSLQLGLRLK
jgi:hypothetical protein